MKFIQSLDSILFSFFFCSIYKSTLFQTIHCSGLLHVLSHGTAFVLTNCWWILLQSLQSMKANSSSTYYWFLQTAYAQWCASIISIIIITIRTLGEQNYVYCANCRYYLLTQALGEYGIFWHCKITLKFTMLYSSSIKSHTNKCVAYRSQKLTWTKSRTIAYCYESSGVLVVSYVEHLGVSRSYSRETNTEKHIQQKQMPRSETVSGHSVHRFTSHLAWLGGSSHTWLPFPLLQTSIKMRNTQYISTR